MQIRFFKKEKGMKQKNGPTNVSDAAEKYEKCVMCGKITDILKSVPINQRVFYVEGCGQLCESCAGNMANEQMYDSDVSNDQMRQLLDSLRAQN